MSRAIEKRILFRELIKTEFRERGKMHLSVDNQEYTENIWIGGVRRRTRNEDLERLRVTVCCQP